MSIFPSALPILVLCLFYISNAFLIPPRQNATHLSLTAKNQIGGSGISSDVEGTCVPVGSAFPNDLVLRILPLGASIVYGTDSSDGNGFRGPLRDQLIANGASVNYVGEFQAGTMLDNDVSGFPGYRIDQVAPKMEDALPWLPNLIIIHVGKFLGLSFLLHKVLGRHTQ